jgi:SAM-dependent methyltransferase
MSISTTLHEEDYVRRRLEPKKEDADYIHLSDMRVVLNQFETDDPIRLLDFGCGGSPYHSLFPNADYLRADFTGVDLDYVIGEKSKIDEADEVFDLILSTQVAEHVEDPHSYFAESYRLLKKGGRFICTTHGTYPDHGCPYDFQRWTADGLKRDITAAGFSVVETYKLTTNARAIMYLLRRFTGWIDTASSGLWAFLFRVFRSFIHRRSKFWHRLADGLFSKNRVVAASADGHEFYIGLTVVAVKQ